MRKVQTSLLVVIIVLLYSLPLLAGGSEEILNVAVGQSQLLRYDKVQRVAVANPEIAEVVVVSASEVLVNGIQPGVTTLHVWLAQGYKRLVLRIYDDFSFTVEEIQTAIGDPSIIVTKVKNTVILKGTVANQHVKAEILQIAGSFGDKVVDLLTVKQSLQVLIKAYVVELNRERLQELGLEWGEISKGVFKPNQVLFGQLNLNEALFQLNPLGTQLKAMEKQNISRTLAAPELVAMSGQRSEIIVGGEIPVITSSEVIWKPYGIILNVEPEVLKNGEIQVILEPEVSTVDWDNAIKFNDIEYPAFRTRRLKTTVTVTNGSTIVLGGLLNQDDMTRVKKIPFLGDLPILGELFRSNEFRRGESELVVMVQTWVLDASKTVELHEVKEPFVEEQKSRLEKISREVEGE